MKIHLLGINHFDPLCRGRLISSLEKLSQAHSEGPFFVGVEWDCEHFATVRSQRKIFHALVADLWPGRTSLFYSLLEVSLAYEGDAHVEVFPDVPILWLDGGRSGGGAIENYAHDRLKLLRGLYREATGPETPPRDDEEALSILGRAAWERSNRHNFILNPERDQKWFALVNRQLDDRKEGWAILIVGDQHSRRIEGSVRSLLDADGIECQTTSLRPT